MSILTLTGFLILANLAASQPDAAQTILWGDALTVVRAGETSSFFLQTRDASGP